MSAPEFHVVGLGNAIVDVLAHADDTFLIANGIEKGAMTLVDEARAKELYDALGQTVQVSGGSAANTIAGVGSLGGKAAFIGKVRNDQLGTAFTHDIRSLGVAFDTPAADRGPATGRCLIVVSPDAERSMSTYLGAAQDLTPDDVDVEVISKSAITYLEGYLWDPEEQRSAMRRAIEVARKAGRKVAFTASESFVIDRHGDDFRKMIEEGLIDIMFVNETELATLTGESEVEAGLAALDGKIPVLVATRSAKGAVGIANGQRAEVNAEPVEKVIDTTGAGDLFAAGFLTGHARGENLETCLRMGSICAAEIISHYGARPEVDLKALMAEKLG